MKYYSDGELFTVRCDDADTEFGSETILWREDTILRSLEEPSIAPSPSGKAQGFDLCIFRWFKSSRGCSKIMKKGVAQCMDDLISRQEAIDALEREQSLVERPITETRWFDLGLRKAQDVLSELPSAQPNLQPTCNQLATNLQPIVSADRMRLKP